MSFTLDSREFSQTARELKRVLKKDSVEIVKQQTRLGVRDAVKMTPPFKTGGPRESFGVQRKVGQGAIRRELLGGRSGAEVTSQRYAGIFLIIQQWMMQPAKRKAKKAEPTGRTVRLFARKDGSVYGVERELYQPNASIAEMQAHHFKYRSRRTGKVTQAGARSRTIGRWRFIDKMAVKASRMNAYLRHVFLRLGTAKAGWPIRKSGNSAPKWILRNGGKTIWRDETRNPHSPEITFGNPVSWIQGTGKGLRIMERVIKNRIYSMRKVTADTLRRRAARANAR